MSGLTLACLMMLSVAALSIFCSELAKWLAEKERKDKKEKSR